MGNQESWALESGKELEESLIPQKKMESGIQFPLSLESTAWNPELKAVLDPGRLLGEILIECTYACTPSCTRQEY